MIGTKEQNSILFLYTSTGCSLHTARQNGLDEPGHESSQAIADLDTKDVLHIKDRFEAAALKFKLPPALLAALASRESHCGKSLIKGWGDKHHAFGICQVDARSHKALGSDPSGLDHLMQVASILDDYRSKVEEKHPDWEPARQLQGAIVAYNSGVSNVDTIAKIDAGTTGNDYSNDVWSRAQRYAA